MKNKLCIFIVAVLLLCSVFFSIETFGTPNSPAVAVGLFRICVLDAPYTQVGFLSKAFIGNPEDGFSLFLSAMNDMGYIHHPEEQMGSLHCFTDQDGNWVKVLFRINAYYSKWIWC